MNSIFTIYLNSAAKEKNVRIKTYITKVLLLLVVISLLSACTQSNSAISNDESDIINSQFIELEKLLIPKKASGDIDFEKMDISDHQHIAYLLLAESRIKSNPDVIEQLAQYLVDHSDDNEDGEIGWGLGFEWDEFADGSVNPKWHVYTIETANVLQAYVEALLSGCLSDKLSNTLKQQIKDVILVWNSKYWTDSTDSGEQFFYWYSISENDAKPIANIDAKMIGVQAQVMHYYKDLFSKSEQTLIYNHIDCCYAKLIQCSYFEDNSLIWNYFEYSDVAQNDAIHHGFILEGLDSYLRYRYGKGIPADGQLYTGFIYKCLNDNTIYRYPDYKTCRCFETGAIRWIKDRSVQKDLLISAYEQYVGTDDIPYRQLAFLFDSMSLYISTE